MDRVADSTNQSVSFAAFTTATGAAVTVTSATAGLSLWYRRGNVGAKTAITPSNLAAINSVHADGGLIVIEAQDHRLDLPDAAFAAGVDYLEWGGSATGITIDGGSCNLIGQPTTGSVGTPLTSAQTQFAAAAAITAAQPIRANAVEIGGVSVEPADISQDIRDAMELESTSGEDSIDDKLNNKTGYKLAPDGLDAIEDPDDLTTVPTTFGEKLRWLIQRFWRADKTPTIIRVKNEAGDTITTQAVTDDQAGTETLGAPQ